MNQQIHEINLIHRLILFLVFVLGACICTVHAQESTNRSYDTNYIQKFPGKVHYRGYFSKKYTNFQLRGDKNNPNLTYKPNSSMNLGVGGTYGFLTLNLGYGFKFINPEKGKGKTRYLDLQSHIYKQKWALDFFGQFYKGYYLPLNDYRPTLENIYYNRPDLGVTLLGIVGFRVLNDKKFAYSSSILLNAWQKRSAGSFLLGAELYYGIVSADSAFLPKRIQNFYAQKDIRRLRFTEIGPSVGYAYTLVIKQNFFATGSVSASLDLSFVKESTNELDENHFGLSPNFFYRFALGYTQRGIWGVNATMLGNRIKLRGESPGHKYDIFAGNFRITYNHLLTPGPKLKKYLAPIDKLMKKSD